MRKMPANWLMTLPEKKRWRLYMLLTDVRAGAGCFVDPEAVHNTEEACALAWFSKN
jgi:hypothetical protein